jgi:hypothetical protein
MLTISKYLNGGSPPQRARVVTNPSPWPPTTTVLGAAKTGTTIASRNVKLTRWRRRRNVFVFSLEDPV